MNVEQLREMEHVDILTTNHESQSKSKKGLYCLKRDVESHLNEAQKSLRKQVNQKSEVDGYQAWLTLACIFITNATTLGSLKVYGLIYQEIVAQKYYNREEASWPISTASTVQNMAGK